MSFDSVWRVLLISRLFIQKKGLVHEGYAFFSFLLYKKVGNINVCISSTAILFLQVGLTYLISKNYQSLLSLKQIDPTERNSIVLDTDW